MAGDERVQNALSSEEMKALGLDDAVNGEECYTHRRHRRNPERSAAYLKRRQKRWEAEDTARQYLLAIVNNRPQDCPGTPDPFWDRHAIGESGKVSVAVPPALRMKAAKILLEAL